MRSISPYGTLALILAASYAVSVKAKTKDTIQRTTKTPASTLQMRMFGSLVIPDLDFNQVPLESVLQAISQKAAAIDRRVAANFVVETGVDLSKPITLRLVNTPLVEVLLYLADLANTDFEINRYAISAKPRKSAQTWATMKTPPSGQQLQTLQGLMISNVNFRGISLEAALESLRQKAISASGGSVQPYFIIDPRLNASAPLTLNLAQIPFTEALHYMGDLANTDFVVERYAISVKRREIPPAKPSEPPFQLVK